MCNPPADVGSANTLINNRLRQKWRESQKRASLNREGRHATLVWRRWAEVAPGFLYPHWCRLAGDLAAGQCACQARARGLRGSRLHLVGAEVRGSARGRGQSVTSRAAERGARSCGLLCAAGSKGSPGPNRAPTWVGRPLWLVGFRLDARSAPSPFGFFCRWKAALAGSAGGTERGSLTSRYVSAKGDRGVVGIMPLEKKRPRAKAAWLL